MESIYEVTLLFDFYGELLTENQKDVVRMHVLEDYSLGEISEILNISRQGVHDSLRRALHALQVYEEALHLVSRFQHIRALATEARGAAPQDKDRFLDDIINYTMEID